LKFLLTMLGVNAFILLNPFLLLAAAWYGSEDERWLMSIAFWVCLPFTVWMWYLIVRFWRVTHGKA
jgi:hypothetical protein